MRTGVALCHHLWRNAVPCDEALVMGDAQEDQGFDRSAEGMAFVDCDGDGFGTGTLYGCGNGDGFGAGDVRGVKFGDGFGYVNGSGSAFGNEEGDVRGDGDGDGHRDGHGDGFGIWYRFRDEWDRNTPYPFPDEALEVLCEPE